MAKDYITDTELVNVMIDNAIKRAVNKLGLEGTLESIENINLPIYRAKLRQGYFRYLKRRS